MNKLKTIKKIYIFVETILGHFKPLSIKKYMKIYSSTDNRYISLKTAFIRIFPKKDKIIILNYLKIDSNGNCKRKDRTTIRNRTSRKHTVQSD